MKTYSITMSLDENQLMDLANYIQLCVDIKDAREDEKVVKAVQGSDSLRRTGVYNVFNGREALRVIYNTFNAQIHEDN